jgi:hypothetical protein
MSRYVNMEQRLIANSVLDIDTGCWIWIAARDKRASTPYGKISVYDKTVSEGPKHRKRQAHIVSYETFKGPIPEGREVDHVCRNGFCIAPDHLEAVEPRVNKERRIWK